MEELIKLAIEKGGYMEGYAPEVYGDPLKWDRNELVLDRSFWQALMRIKGEADWVGFYSKWVAKYFSIKMLSMLEEREEEYWKELSTYLKG